MNDPNSSHILLIDTCGQLGSIALVGASGDPARIASAQLPGRAASERLIPEIKALALSGGIDLHTLGAIAVVNGPGSFTGVRVGLSAAKGLCEALNIPIIAISRLAVLAHLANTPAAKQVRAILDAGRGEFYSGLYSGSSCIREELLNRDELVAASQSAPSARLITCEVAVAQAIADLHPLSVSEPQAHDAFPLVLERLHAERFEDLSSMDANYLRRTDAEIFAKQAAHKAASV